MKNAINYYYNLNPNEIHQINKIYRFHISNINYVLCPCYRTEEEIKEIYELHQKVLQTGYYCHQIILNVNNEITTHINGICYILLRAFVENRLATLPDIIAFNNMYMELSKYHKIQRIGWYKLWIEKIDYIEYQISQFGKKYPLIRESSDYYIGIVENCISLLANITPQNTIMTVSHDRINKECTLFELYNPINFILDHRVRDMGEYLKNDILNDNNITLKLQNYIYSNNLSEYEIILLFIRILYPSHYFDMCEQIIDNKKKEEELLPIINNVEKYEYNIKIIYNYIRSITQFPEIDWLLRL